VFIRPVTIDLNGSGQLVEEDFKSNLSIRSFTPIRISLGIPMYFNTLSIALDTHKTFEAVCTGDFEIP
jgi:hypothetical protein